MIYSITRSFNNAFHSGHSSLRQNFLGIAPSIVQRSLSSYQGSCLTHSITSVLEKAKKGDGDRFSIVQKLQDGNRSFFVIHRDDQIELINGDITNEQFLELVNKTGRLYQEIRSHILASIGANSIPFVEVVGDSAPFSLEGTLRARDFIARHIKNNVTEYGYTGYVNKDGTRCTNAIVSELVVKNRMLDLTIGNLVATHTPIALEKWGCSGPDLRYYTLVHPARFGDDIITTDYLADRLVVTEGGIQTFAQICNFLLLGKPVYAIKGLRGDKTRFAYDEGVKKTYFSATEFIEFLKQECEKVLNLEPELLDQLKDKYLDPNVRLLTNPKRGDAGTKQALIDKGWKLFKDMKLYEKLNLVFIESC